MAHPIPSFFELKIREELMEKAIRFYESLGFIFKPVSNYREPTYFISEGEFSFCLYPLPRADGYPMPQARLGFSVNPEAQKNLEAAGFETFNKDYGALAKDPQGRSIELYFKKS